MVNEAKILKYRFYQLFANLLLYDLILVEQKKLF